MIKTHKMQGSFLHTEVPTALYSFAMTVISTLLLGYNIVAKYDLWKMRERTNKTILVIMCWSLKMLKLRK